MKNLSLLLLIIAMTAFTVGCAITDYSGFADHKTTGEAKLWGKEVAFSGAGDLSGTYAYVVRYDNRGGQGKVYIDSLRNPVEGSFTREGSIDQDGNDIQGGGGILGGTFQPAFKAVDSTGGGTCEFDGNLTNFGSTSPGILLCATTNEEVDRDAELHASFSSVDDLLAQIWAGTLSGNFTTVLTTVTIDGAPFAVNNVQIGAYASGLRPTQFSIDVSQPGMSSLIQGILDNTQHGVGHSVGFGFDGGLTVNAPANVQVAFDHNVLSGLL